MESKLTSVGYFFYTKLLKSIPYMIDFTTTMILLGHTLWTSFDNGQSHAK